MEPDWANLDALALSLIFYKLDEWIDHVWFGVVCKNWLSVVRLNHQNQQLRPNVLPMVMIPKTKLCLYGISSRRTYAFQFPVPYYDRCCGCSHGWIATFNKKYPEYFAMDIVITMFNPFKSASPITLPPLHTIRDQYDVELPKVTLSADPMTSPNNYVVAVLHKKCTRLSIIKAGQTRWTSLDNYRYIFMDAIFYRDSIYGLTKYDGLLSFDLSYLDDPDSTETINPIPEISFLKDLKCYLVKSLQGDLWIVRKVLNDENIEYNHNVMIKFEVYKLEIDAQSKEIRQIEKLESLGDNVLFVRDCDSISASASYFSGRLKQDSIYYINKIKHYTPFHQYCEPFNIEIYNVKDGSICHQYPEYSFVKHMPTPFWILLPFQ